MLTSHPPSTILQELAPKDVWNQVIKQAKRSPMIRFRAGAVIYDPKAKKIISTGCAYPSTSNSFVRKSVHAECHALSRGRPSDFAGNWALIYTIGRNGSSTWSSRPCISCARRLYAMEVERAVYAERTPTGWIMRSDSIKELVRLSPAPRGHYARFQRILT